MNKLDTKKRAQILALLVEGNSINATCRITGAAKNTVLKLLADAGAACAEFQDKAMRNLPCKRLQADEIWSFVGMKQKNVPEDVKGVFGIGDVYTWIAIDADTKLVPCWHIGMRDADAANEFMSDLSSRLANRVQLTTDGYKAYIEAVEEAFGQDIDYAMLLKLYGVEDFGKAAQRRYSPAKCTGIEKKQVMGDPDMKETSTSYIERQNLTMRMHMRRFTRLTNAFSKKLENHMHAISLHFMYYNFCRIHKTLRVTPAMEAKIADHVWTLEEVVGLIHVDEPKKRGPYRKST